MKLDGHGLKPTSITLPALSGNEADALAEQSALSPHRIRTLSLLDPSFALSQALAAERSFFQKTVDSASATAIAPGYNTIAIPRPSIDPGRDMHKILGEHDPWPDIGFLLFILKQVYVE